MKATDIKNLCKEARPIIERMLDDAETLAAFREAATNKGLDWSQVKALLKAQIQDERDGDGNRVNKIIEKADNASAYADLLGLKMNEKNFSAGPAIVEVHTPEGSGTVTEDPFHIPDDLKRKRAS